MDALVEAVLEEKKRQKLTDAGLANKLGLDPASWNRIKHGQELPTRKMYEGVAKSFPQLGVVLQSYMAKRAQ